MPKATELIDSCSGVHIFISYFTTMCTCQNRPESSRCWQHRGDSGPVLAHYGMFTGKGFERSCWYFISNDALSNNANQTVCANLYGVQI